MDKPIKRHNALIPISREHHFGLLLSWKIRVGLKKDIDPERIIKYCKWFYENNLLHHFKIEEQYIYPILGNSHPLIIQALSEHRSIEYLIKHAHTDLKDALNTLEKTLDAHIRLEERNIFNIIQDIATEAQLKLIEAHHNTPFDDSWVDEFWAKKTS